MSAEAFATRHLVDPELLPQLDAMPPFEVTAENLQAARENLWEMEAATPADVTIETRQVPGFEDDPKVSVILTRPSGRADSPRPAVLMIHSGGYVMGNARQCQALANAFADELGCVVASVDYRLAPETPHPGPLHDCYAALTWLHDNADELNVDPDLITVYGESAGGGLAATLAQFTRDQGQVPLRLQVLMYGMLDDRTATRTDLNPHTGQYIWTPASNTFGWESLLGHKPGGRTAPEYAVAARAKDLTGLPPTFIAVGALDLLLDEALEYADQLLRAAVPTELHVYPGAPHGIGVAPGRLAASVDQELKAALKQAFAPSQ
ncbi:alpha/beta hydrolase [Streptomyces sp. CBMA152]|uniref:alpha/beta hydrolase n=1 Tax=Streptomyces sp. CBMA152 TaxID=1896312 RepID=UPI0016611A5E|nr:alpha/beta hydrolase [Streptomyces sp. CBMA152]MBD0741353.1 hypothetical protein [Streptomyces sp. CBMA152]